MATIYSSDLKLSIMATGENAGTWGQITNTNLYLLQQAIGGYEAISIAGGAQTTTLTMSNGAISNARNAVIKLTGTITGNQIVTVPTGIEKTYIVSNGTVGAFTVQFIQAGGTGVTFATTDKSTKILFADGTNIVDTGTVSETGIQTLTNKTLTSPIVNEIDDANSNEQIKFTATASAVNEFTVTNAATGNAPEISATGGDTNIDLKITPKGTGKVNIDGIKYPNADGSANQVLKTDGSGNLSFATPSAGFSGSTTTSSAVDITLTSASTQVQNITMTAADKSVILPDATTLTTKGFPIFVIVNNGVFNINIKNNGGFIIAISQANTSTEFTLIDNSTSSGTFATDGNSINLGLSPITTIKAGTTGTSTLTGTTNPVNVGIGVDKLTSTTAIIFYVAGTSNRDVYGVVVSYSGTTITVNSETLLYSGSSSAATCFTSVVLDATTGLIIVARTSNKIAVPFTISGTTITAGTASSTFGTGSGSAGGFTKPVAVSSTLACLFDNTATDNSIFKLRTIQHNGASAPTIGTASSGTITTKYDEWGPVLSPISATKVFIAYADTSTEYTIARIGTLDGTNAPTLETANTSSVTANNYDATPHGIKQVSSTEFLYLGTVGTDRYTVSGTTVTYDATYLYATANTLLPNYYAFQTEAFGNYAIISIYNDTKIYLLEKTGNAYYVKQIYLSANEYFSFNNATTGSFVPEELDSTTILAVSNNLQVGTKVSAYLIKYIGA
jgi:hypothetical protein